MRLIPEQCINLVKRCEGLRLNVYGDATGLKTIGYGHLLVQADGDLQSITEDEAVSILTSDLQQAANSVIRLIRVPLDDNQFSALTDFCFNLGGACLQASSLRMKLNRGDYKGAADVFPRYVYAGARVLPGLVDRRAAERRLFLS